MDFELSDDQRMLSDTVESFVKKDSPVTRFRKLRDDEIGWSPEVWAQMGELGWLSIGFAEDKGGLGGSFVDVALILEKLGTTLVPEPFIPSVVLAGQALALLGTEEQRGRWLEPMLIGKTSLALAYAEPDSRYSVAEISTKAEQTDGGYALTGRKSFVLNGHRADQIIISAMTEGGLGLFVVEGNDGRMQKKPVKTMDGQRGASLSFEGLEVNANQMLGKPGRTLDVLEQVIDYGAAAACAEAVGVSQAMMEITLDYLKTREQFGKKIGSFQALQHKAVDMFVEMELIRSVSMMASIKVDDPDANERKAAVSAAKARLTESSNFLSRQAIQLHGGIGVTDEADIGLYFKRINCLNALFGDHEHHVDRYAGLASFV